MQATNVKNFAAMTLDGITAALAKHGLMTRGAFHPNADDEVPAGIGTLVLVGNAGPAMWRVFEAERQVEANPLDSWCRRVLTGVGAALGARPLFPFDGPPWLPFQRWAMRADDVHPSPIGPLIHPVHGLWHAYRGALAFVDRLDLPDTVRGRSPCESCAAKPCLSACPVDAFASGRYDVLACTEHVVGAKGMDCLNLGCAARRACPVGRDHRYLPAQAYHHMRHFADAAHRGPWRDRG